VASDPGPPARGPGRLAGSLARHRWITAAGMTATVAAVAGGGVALAFHDGSAAPRQECGLVPCAAALPASVQSGGREPASGAGPASTPTAASPTVPQRAPAPPSPPEAISFPAPVASSAGRAVSADRAIGVSYAITEDGEHGILGQIVIVNNGSAPVSGWRVRVVLPGDTHYQVLSAGNRSAGDALVMTSAAGQALAGGGTELVAFTARGSTSTPVRCTFTDSRRARRHVSGGSGAAAGQETSAGGGRAGSGRSGHDRWPGGWPGGWLSSNWPNGGWPNGGWAPQDGSGGGWTGGGSDGQHHG
jgi:hypothetical protein